MAITLVTGAAGFAGSHLLDLLTSDGTASASDTIVAWRRPANSKGTAEVPAPGVEWETVDVLDRDAVRSAVARIRPSIVYHCAGAAHVGRAWDAVEPTFAVNVRGTHHVLDALWRANVDATVLVPSSALVYAAADRALVEDDPLVPSSPYGVSKLAQEMTAGREGGKLRILVARAFNHFGPRQDPFFVASGFARRIADIERGRWKPQIAVGNLDARRDLTDVRDTIRAYKLIVEHGSHGDVFNVCSGIAIEIRSLLERLISRARVPVEIVVDPARYRPNDTPLIVGNPGRIRSRLGWTPQIPLDRTLDDLLEYWREKES